MNTTPESPTALATAYALGELTDAERAAFEAQMENDPALAALVDETREFCSLLDEKLTQPTPELQEAARARLLFEAGKAHRDAKVVRHRWVRRLTAMAACVAAGGIGTYIWKGDRAGQYESTARFKIMQSSAPDIFNTSEENRRAMEKRAGSSEQAEELANPVAATATAPATEEQKQLITYSPSELRRQQAALAKVQGLPADAKSGFTLPDTHSSFQTTSPQQVAGGQMSGSPGMGGGFGSGKGTGRGSGVGAGMGAGVGDGWGQGGGVARSLAKSASYDGRGRNGLPADGLFDGEKNMERRDYRYVPGESAPGTESYAALAENPFLGVQKAPLSTFSIDVDTASYSNVRRYLNQNQAPPPEAVRLEELVNYFPYDYAQPVDGKPFAVHVEMTSAPWNAQHRLARIALKGKEIHAEERPAANLVFLVDVSGSMQPENKLPLVKQSLRFVVERLTEKDSVALVTYAGESGVALPPTSGADKARIMGAIDGLGAGGSTNGAGGINAAYAEAAKNFRKEGINRVILATDGDFNVGVTSHGDLQRLIEEKRATGVFLSLLGYGMGNNKDDTMELLANKGNGNYAYIDSLSEARKALGEQFSGTLVTIAKDVKIQIEFNPAVIQSYRLLGYENRMLAKEDFNDDKKDAGEIGAGHTVTALYELVPVGAVEQPVTTVDGLKYQPKPAEPAPPAAPAVPAEMNAETMTVKLRWKAPDADVSQIMEVPVKDAGAKIADASPETKWAVAVAGFASLMRHSQFAGTTWEDIRTLAKAGKGADANGYRGEFLQLLDKAQSARR